MSDVRIQPRSDGRAAEPDIVERLRSHAAVCASPHRPNDRADDDHALFEASVNQSGAADEITRLRTALATEYARGVEDAAKVASDEEADMNRVAASFRISTVSDNSWLATLHEQGALVAGRLASAIRALVPKP